MRIFKKLFAVVLSLTVIITGTGNGLGVVRAANPMSPEESEIYSKIISGDYIESPMPDEPFNEIRITCDKEYLVAGDTINLFLESPNGGKITDGISWYFHSPYGFTDNDGLNAYVYSAGQSAPNSILSVAANGTVTATNFTTPQKTYAPNIYAEYNDTLYLFQIDRIMRSQAENAADADLKAKETAVNNEIDRLVSALNLNSLPTKLEKVQAVHDYMAKNILYHMDAHNGKGIGLLYETLIEKEAVCEGYAYAFLKIMQRTDVDCELLEGPIDAEEKSNFSIRHAWNAVELDDDCWYYLDVTWDSNMYMGHSGNPINPPRPSRLYRYFLQDPAVFLTSHSTRLPEDYTIGSRYIGAKNDTSTQREIYTSNTDGNNNSGDGSEGNPYNLISTAIASANSGDTIIVKGSGYSNEQGSGNPLIIDKSIIIKGEGSFPKVDIRNPGIILGSNVTLENLTISFPNADRNAIIANGYTLKLDGIKNDSSTQPVNLFCGGIEGFIGSASLPARGSHGKIIIDNGYSLGEKSNIYAGNILDVATAPNKTFTGKSSVIINGMNNSQYLGNFYAYGGLRSNPTGIDFSFSKIEPPAPNESINVTGDINVTLNSTAIRHVYGNQGGGKYANVTYIDTTTFQAYVGNVVLESIGDLNVKQGYIIPAAGSSFGKTNPNITIAYDSRLGLNNFGSSLRIGNYNGVGGLILGPSQLLTIAGTVIGKSYVAINGMSPRLLNYRSEGDFTPGRKYIQATNSTASSFVAIPKANNDIVFERGSSGDWIAVSDRDNPPSGSSGDNPPSGPSGDNPPSGPSGGGDPSGDNGDENTGIEVSVNRGSATISNITSDNIKEIAKGSSGNKLTIDVAKETSSSVNQVSFSKNEAQLVSNYLSSSSNNKSVLEIGMSDTVLRIDKEALSSITNQAKGSDIKLNVAKKSESGLNTSQKNLLTNTEVIQVFEAYITSGINRITNFGGGNITVGKIDFVRASDKSQDKYTVVYLPQNGNMERMRTWFENGHIYFETSHFSDFAIVYDDSVAQFVDVSKGAYYYDAGIWAANKGITTGYDKTHFAPGDYCKRGQVVTFLWRAKGCPEPKKMSGFTDVSDNSYYAKAVAWAVENGITTGTSPTKFSPEKNCTRADFVTLLWRSADKPAPNVRSGFLDVEAGKYYTDAVDWAAENKITTGKTSKSFDPKSDCKRGEVVTFLYRFF